MHILGLSENDQREAFAVAGIESGRAPQVLEKDVWVVWVLNALFKSPHGRSLAFKGGTSLSKAYKLIERFSEDVDLTYDVRRLIDGLEGDPEVIPSTPSQVAKITKRVRTKLPRFVRDTLQPVLLHELEKAGLPASLEFKDQNNDVTLKLAYRSAFDQPGYMRDHVLLEFGARSTGEPTEEMEVSCDAAPFLAGVEFPKAKPRVMMLARTFWEKATAVHSYCCSDRLPGRVSRHWYDLAQLYGKRPDLVRATVIANQVVEHKTRFFRTRDVDLMDTISGRLRLRPQSKELLLDDYERMRENRFLPDNAESFEEILAVCAELEMAANEFMSVAPALYR